MRQPLFKMCKRRFAGTLNDLYAYQLREFYLRIKQVDRNCSVVPVCLWLKRLPCCQSSCSEIEVGWKPVGTLE